MNAKRRRTRRHKTQSFVHTVTYRFNEVFLDGATERSMEDKVSCVMSALGDVCGRNGWRLVAWDALPDRVEALLTGEEPEGRAGREVAEALDQAVHGAALQQAAVN